MRGVLCSERGGAEVAESGVTPAAELVADVFSIRCRILTDPDSRTPLIVPVARL